MAVVLSIKDGDGSMRGVQLLASYVMAQKGCALQMSAGDNLLTAFGIEARSPTLIMKVLADSFGKLDLYPKDALQRTECDSWADFGTRGLSAGELRYLDNSLSLATHLVGNRLTIADFAIMGALLGCGTYQGSKGDYTHISRYYSHLRAQAPFDTAVEAGPVKESMQQYLASGRKAEGKYVELPGAVQGEVVVRFPPEASGYLHIGHAKAALLNEYYAQSFEGKLIMRFDDTNPAKESEEFEKVVLEDVARMGIKPDCFTRTSDHFETLLQLCEKLIKQGDAYVDDTPAERMKIEREQRQESVHRGASVAANLALWGEMKAGSDKGQICAVRAKINMQSDNGALRDPAIYRCKNEAHLRFGNKYRVYPTYDFACPVVDSIEGVTHALRTMEYHDRDEQYYWFCDKLSIRKPTIWEFARLNMQSTVMSKRKLTWLVNEGIVSGWDDPRLPTVRGVMRRGMTVAGLKEFVINQGGSRSVTMMEWDKIWSFNKKVIDPIAPRYTALLQQEAIPVDVKGVKWETKSVPAHPKNTEVGEKDVSFGPVVMVEGADAETLKEGETVTLINWGNMTVKQIHRDENNKVTRLTLDPDLENKNYKQTAKLTWLGLHPTNAPVPCVCVTFDAVISKPILDKDDDFKKYINYNSARDSRMLGDPCLRALKKGDTIQLQRRGFYICDRPFEEADLHTGQPSPCVLFYVPDGHTKEMPTAGSKHKASGEDKSTKGGSSSGAGRKKQEKGTKQEPTSAPVKVEATRGVKEALALITSCGDSVRQLKGQIADKGKIDAAVAELLASKTEYKQLTGVEWKPQLIEQSSGKVAAAGEAVRTLKSSKAEKDKVDAAVKSLLDLKAEYKTLAGEDWTAAGSAPPTASVPAPAAPSSGGGVKESLAKITACGNAVRELKSAKADKGRIDAAVAELLASKTEYKQLTGVEWKPQLIEQSAAKVAVAGEAVRTLKSSKAEKDKVDAAVKELLDLKAQYKSMSGEDWKAAAPPATTTPAVTSGGDAEKLKADITAQGEVVRDIKASGDKARLDSELAKLLKLKTDYKELTGTDVAPPARGGKEKAVGGEKKEKPKKQEKQKKVVEVAAEGDEKKKQSRLGLEAKKEENLPEWYSQVITKADMIEYYDVSGCYILRPGAYSIWEYIQSWFDAEIKKLGVENCYFPMFVSKSALEKEKDHIEDFAPEVAWVTKSGNTDMPEPVAIRPTSETVMYPAFAKWVQSHRDLPIRLNQWCSVVRWEFKHPTPFIRTREFLWQEGHTAFANPAEAEKEVYQILELYAAVYEQLLAIPVVRGKKTEKEKFAGAAFTTTAEVYIAAAGRGLQGATSHHLGQNFSKMFNIEFENPEKPGSGEKKNAWQNSWGLSTRSLGALVMVHGDDNGLVLPPRVASTQVVIVPCGITASLSVADKAALLDKCAEYRDRLVAGGVRARLDDRDNYSPGWKFNYWELRGVPVRVEVGPRDMAGKQYVSVTRFDGFKSSGTEAGVVTELTKLLDNVQSAMYNKALSDRAGRMSVVTDWAAFCSALDAKHIIMAPFCGAQDCEDTIKTDSARNDIVEEGAPSMGAKSLCIPLKQPADIKPSDKCINAKCNSKPKFYTLFGRSY